MDTGSVGTCKVCLPTAGILVGATHDAQKVGVIEKKHAAGLEELKQGGLEDYNLEV